MRWSKGTKFWRWHSELEKNIQKFGQPEKCQLSEEQHLQIISVTHNFFFAVNPGAAGWDKFQMEVRKISDFYQRGRRGIKGGAAH